MFVGARFADKPNVRQNRCKQARFRNDSSPRDPSPSDDSIRVNHGTEPTDAPKGGCSITPASLSISQQQACDMEMCLLAFIRKTPASSATTTEPPRSASPRNLCCADARPNQLGLKGRLLDALCASPPLLGIVPIRVVTLRGAVRPGAQAKQNSRTRRKVSTASASFGEVRPGLGKIFAKVCAHEANSNPIPAPIRGAYDAHHLPI